MEPASGAAMAEENLSDLLRRRWASVVGVFAGPAIDPAIGRPPARRPPEPTAALLLLLLLSALKSRM